MLANKNVNIFYFFTQSIGFKFNITNYKVTKIDPNNKGQVILFIMLILLKYLKGSNILM